MSDVERYSGKVRVGCPRSLTDGEKAEWQPATANWHEAPPWTEQTLADNEIVRKMLIALFEDGVSLPTLAAAAGWGHPRVAGMIHRLRQDGRLSGERRYIAPATKVAKNPFRRSLTEDETTRLTEMYARLPQHASGARGWKSPEAQELLGHLHALNTDHVALDTLAIALGVTRQAIHQHVSKFRAQQANGVTVRETASV